MCQIRKVMVATQVLFYNYSLFRDSFFLDQEAHKLILLYTLLLHLILWSIVLQVQCNWRRMDALMLLSITTICYQCHIFFQCLLTICTLPPWVTLTLTESASVALSPSVLLSVKCFPVFKEDVQVCFETLFCEHCSNLSRLLVVSTRKFRIDLFTVTAHFFLGCASSFFFFFFFAVDLRFCSVMLLL